MIRQVRCNKQGWDDVSESRYVTIGSIIATDANSKWERRILYDYLEKQPAAAPVDRVALLYLMQQFDAESWQCPQCGHAEDTATMDSAHYLRRYLAENPVASTPAAPGIDHAEMVKSNLRSIKRLATVFPISHVSAANIMDEANHAMTLIDAASHGEGVSE